MEPIDNITWVKAQELTSNDYNPNIVFTPELKLLERSIIKTGWVQPILISRDNVIIDGFHRWMLSKDSPALKDKYKGLVPVAILDVDRAIAMVMTVRMNRAKGSAVAVDMAKLVKELINDLGLLPEQVAQEIGATSDEVNLLLQEGVFKAKDTKNWKYSKAWYPAESKTKHVD